MNLRVPASALAGAVAVLFLVLASPLAAYAAEDDLPACTDVLSNPDDFAPDAACVENGTLVEDEVDFGAGIPAVFGVFFVLVLVSGIGFTVWQVSKTRSMARRAGMDPDEATAMTLLSDGGFEATYLAANLRDRPAATPVAVPDAAERLRQLQSLKDQGLVTEGEYAARRQAIIDQI